VKKILLPYGKEFLSYDISDSRFKGELVSLMHHYKAAKNQEELVREALEHPVGTPPLRKIAEGKKKAVLIASDHTRPVPSKIIIPQMLAEIRKGSPDVDITILIATGCHRETTKVELESKFGIDIMNREKIVIHDCDSKEMVYLGKLPSGGELFVNKIAVETELLVAEGFIEPHFFSFFSGGRKSVFPGIASRKTVIYSRKVALFAYSKLIQPLLITYWIRN
jgi:nickel-dependent lactate racemase